MKRIFRVPVDTEHFEYSVLKGINGCSYWGSLPGGNNLRTFEQLRSGDEILFYRNGKYVAVAEIEGKMVDPESARRWWGETKDGRTWELIYRLCNVKMINVPTGRLNSEFGLKLGHVMGFSKLSDERVQPFLQKYGSVAKFIKEHV